MSPWARNGASMWPAMWWTGTSGLPCTKAMALAAWTPDQQRADQARPLGHGDRVEVGEGRPRRRQGRVITGQMFSMWWREASSGTTPP